MQNRSWLLVPGDDEQALSRAVAVGADTIVVDLADSVPPHAARAARALAAEWLTIHRQQITGRPLGRWVRVNGIDTGFWREDVAAAMRGAPDGFVLPRATGPESVQALAREIYEQEQANQIPSGSTRIVATVGGSALAALTVAAYVEAPLPRLAGLTWNPAELAEALGARERDEAEAWTDTFRFVRAQLLLAARARGISAIDTFHADPTDEAGLRMAARAMRADGFTGMLAIDPAQVPAIHAAFAPREALSESALPEPQDAPVLSVKPAKRMLDLDALAAAPTLRSA